MVGDRVLPEALDLLFTDEPHIDFLADVPWRAPDGVLTDLTSAVDALVADSRSARLTVDTHPMLRTPAPAVVADLCAIVDFLCGVGTVRGGPLRALEYRLAERFLSGPGTAALAERPWFTGVASWRPPGGALLDAAGRDPELRESALELTRDILRALDGLTPLEQRRQALLELYDRALRDDELVRTTVRPTPHPFGAAALAGLPERWAAYATDEIVAALPELTGPVGYLSWLVDGWCAVHQRLSDGIPGASADGTMLGELLLASGLSEPPPELAVGVRGELYPDLFERMPSIAATWNDDRWEQRVRSWLARALVAGDVLQARTWLDLSTRIAAAVQSLPGVSAGLGRTALPLEQFHHDMRRMFRVRTVRHPLSAAPGLTVPMSRRFRTDSGRGESGAAYDTRAHDTNGRHGAHSARGGHGVHSAPGKNGRPGSAVALNGVRPSVVQPEPDGDDVPDRPESSRRESSESVDPSPEHLAESTESPETPEPDGPAHVAGEASVAEAAISEASVGEAPVADTTVAETAISEMSVGDTSVAEAAVPVEASFTDDGSARAPSAGAPGVEAPGVEIPGVEAPGVQAPPGAGIPSTGAPGAEAVVEAPAQPSPAQPSLAEPAPAPAQPAVLDAETGAENDEQQVAAAPEAARPDVPVAPVEQDNADDRAYAGNGDDTDDDPGDVDDLAMASPAPAGLAPAGLPVGAPVEPPHASEPPDPADTSTPEPPAPEADPATMAPAGPPPSSRSAVAPSPTAPPTQPPVGETPAPRQPPAPQQGSVAQPPAAQSPTAQSAADQPPAPQQGSVPQPPEPPVGEPPAPQSPAPQTPTAQSPAAQQSSVPQPPEPPVGEPPAAQTPTAQSPAAQQSSAPQPPTAQPPAAQPSPTVEPPTAQAPETAIEESAGGGFQPVPVSDETSPDALAAAYRVIEAIVGQPALSAALREAAGTPEHAIRLLVAGPPGTGRGMTIDALTKILAVRGFTGAPVRLNVEEFDRVRTPEAAVGHLRERLAACQGERLVAIDGLDRLVSNEHNGRALATELQHSITTMGARLQIVGFAAGDGYRRIVDANAALAAWWRVVRTRDFDADDFTMIFARVVERRGASVTEQAARSAGELLAATPAEGELQNARLATYLADLAISAASRRSGRAARPTVDVPDLPPLRPSTAARPPQQG